MARRSRFSLFSQPLDRAAFIAYFLGAVIPLAVLVYMTQRYLDATGAQEGGASLWHSRWFLLAFIASIAVLSLAGFLALRRSTRQALGRLENDRQRLAGLVKSSRSLAAAAHRSDVLRIAAEHAAGLTAAKATYSVRHRGDNEPTRAHAAGLLAEEIYDAHRGELDRAAAEAMSSRRPVVTELGGSSPHHVDAATAVPCGRDHTLLAVYARQADDLQAGDTHALSTLSGLASAALENAALLADQRNFFTHVTHLLVGALDTHLGFHTDHSKNVARLSVSLGRQLGLDDDRLERLHFAALLHDVGMFEIDPMLCTDRGVIQKHPEIGAGMLERISLWEDLAPVVRHHHEWYDGRGYPRGLAGEDIPYESRIIGLAEAFDSMTNAEGYKPAVEVSRALERIEKASGTQFDPQMVKAFVDLAGQGPLLE